MWNFKFRKIWRVVMRKCMPWTSYWIILGSLDQQASWFHAFPDKKTSNCSSCPAICAASNGWGWGFTFDRRLKHFKWVFFISFKIVIPTCYDYDISWSVNLCYFIYVNLCITIEESPGGEAQQTTEIYGSPPPKIHGKYRRIIIFEGFLSIPTTIHLG